VLAHGFARVRCESCKDELLVAFSCKGRGVCPSCNAKRAHVTAVHLVEQVLPHVPYRQWTLSFPHRVRWVLLKDVGLLSDVLTVFLRAVFALQRRRARRQGLRGGQVGAVSFIQFFGSALQVNRTSTRWCRTASSCRGRAACASSRCRRPRKARWSGC
jgi:transposase-like zinc-binding protein